jgi:putative ABC transport system permease protein
MADPCVGNRAMFWRIIRRLLGANRGRLSVILLALGAGAAVTAALLNLQVDAKRRLTTEFRAFGANVMIAPHSAGASAERAGTLDESVIKNIPASLRGQGISAASFLYLVAEARADSSPKSLQAVVAGQRAARLDDSGSHWEITPPQTGESVCDVGTKVAAQLDARAGDKILLWNGEHQEVCRTEMLVVSGGVEDSQIFLNMDAAQRLAAMPGRVSLVQLSVPGKPEEITNFIASLAQQLPEADVHGIRQFTEAEGKIYNRISGLLTGTVVLVLVLTELCVMAAMSNVAMERMNDVGLMKAIGGSARSVLRLFLAESVLLGLAGGILGSTLGILLSIWLGKSVFGVAARPRLIVYPVAIVLTILVSIASAYPLRRLVSIRPAAVFRGEA